MPAPTFTEALYREFDKRFMPKTKKEQSAAILTIKEPGKMSKKGRKEIAAWLRRQAANLTKDGDKYTEGRFTARYLY